MAAQAAMKMKHQDRRREKAVEAAKNHAAFIKDILKRHNLSKTQTLKFEEVRSWLQMVVNAYLGTLPRNQDTLIEQNFPGTAAALATLNAEVQSPEVHPTLHHTRRACPPAPSLPP